MGREEIREGVDYLKKNPAPLTFSYRLGLSHELDALIDDFTDALDESGEYFDSISRGQAIRALIILGLENFCSTRPRKH